MEKIRDALESSKGRIKGLASFTIAGLVTTLVWTHIVNHNAVYSWVGLRLKSIGWDWWLSAVHPVARPCPSAAGKACREHKVRFPGPPPYQFNGGSWHGHFVHSFLGSFGDHFLAHHVKRCRSAVVGSLCLSGFFSPSSTQNPLGLDNFTPVPFSSALNFQRFDFSAP